jgi:hypothetical protein
MGVVESRGVARRKQPQAILTSARPEPASTTLENPALLGSLFFKLSSSHRQRVVNNNQPPTNNSILPTLRLYATPLTRLGDLRRVENRYL